MAFARVKMATRKSDFKVIRAARKGDFKRGLKSDFNLILGLEK